VKPIPVSFLAAVIGTIVGSLLGTLGCAGGDIVYKCHSNSECAPGVDTGGNAGRCERNGLCSFVDPGCTSGWRYGTLGGTVAGRCIACGDGRLDPGEECDDGNTRDDDACLSSCQRARCGDGVVRAVAEMCDDGNLDPRDGCSTSCLACAGGPTRFDWKANGHCYTRVDTPLTWTDARAACERSDGHLVTYTTGYESMDLSTAILADSSPSYWIGLMSPQGGSGYGWITNEPLVQPSWAMGQPNVMTGACVRQDRQPEPQWSTQACTTALPYICEQPAWVINPGNNHAYRAFFAPVTWEQAVAVCRDRGAHLVTLNDLDEHTWLTAHFVGNIWLGGHDRDQEGTFVWITGEPFEHLRFAPNEPDDQIDQDCLALGAERLWHDRSCTLDRYGFVCEVD
jgi:cysteine-rich repeat protein